MSLLLAVPCAAKNSDIVGGQVTAARGLVSYFDDKKIAYKLVDTAAFASAKSRLGRFFIKLRTFLHALLSAVGGKYEAALFFKSTFSGLPERSVLAWVFRLRGARTGLFFRNSDILALKAGTLKAYVVSWLLKPFSVFFVQGLQWKAHLIQFGIAADRIVVVPNWVPAGFEVASEPKQSDKPLLRFVFTGRIVREKGVFDLLQALSFSGLHELCECVLAGDGPDLIACKTMVQQLGLSNVIFTGNLSASAVRNLLVSADVFVLPTYHPEGFPNSVLEAMAAGLPVISTDVGAVTESVHNGHNGCIVPIKSVSELSKAMRYYVENPAAIPRQSAAALVTVAKRHSRDENCALVINSLISFNKI